MTNYRPPCYCENKHGRVCGKPAHWQIQSATGGYVVYCTPHKTTLAKKLGTPAILAHFQPAPFATFERIV